MKRHRIRPQVLLYYLFKLAVLVVIWVVGIYVWNYGFDYSAVTASVSSVVQSITAPQTNPNSQSTETDQGTGGSGTESDGQDGGQQLVASAGVAPTINLPADNIEVGVVAVSGSGQPGNQVEIVANGNVVGTATVGEDGQWSINANLAEPGDYQLAARALDTNGTVLAESAPMAVRVNTPAQKIVPTINLPGDSVEVGQVSLTGTGQPGGKAAILVNGQMVGIANVDADGTWVYSADFPEPGDYQLSVSALDANSVVLAESEPVFMQVEVGSGTATISLPAGDIQANAGVLSGSGQPGSQIQILVDGQVVGTTTVGEDGRWAYSTDFAKTGDYQLSTRTLDADGVLLAESEPVLMQVSSSTAATTGTTQPTINLPAGDIQVGEVVLIGTGQPGGQIEIMVNGQVVGTTTVGEDGRWAYTADLAEPGDYQLALRALGQDGAVQTESEPVEVKIRPRRLIAPIINRPEGNTETGVVVLTGTGEPNSRIELLVDGEVIGTTTAGSNGAWRLRPFFAGPGDYELTARIVSNEGEEAVVSEPVRLTVVALQPTPTPTSPPPDATPEPDIDQTYIVQVDDWLSKIAEKFYGDPQAYPVIFEGTNEKAAEDDSFEVIEDENLIYIGQKIWIPAIDTISVP